MDYSSDYVKFFLHRHNIRNYANIEAIEQAVFKDPRITEMLKELTEWPCYEIKTHKKVDHPLHRLSFIAELGFNPNDPHIPEITDKILANQSDEGPFQILINIPKQFGGTGQTQKTWVLSDAPVLAYALLKLTGEITPPIRKALDYMADIVSDNGWHCKAAPDLGKFRGPGRVNDPCPYATMFCLKMLGLTPADEYKEAKDLGLKSIFWLWENRTKIKPYLFGMGTDFKKLKLPFVWYDILNMTDTLSLYPEIHSHPAFQEFMDIIHSKKTDDGYVPESIYLKVKNWDFGQKKIPSEWMNAVVERIEKRIQSAK